MRVLNKPTHGKNGFVTATKLGTTNNFFVAATKNFAAATKRFVDRTNLFLSQNIFVAPILTNNFVGITKPFTVHLHKQVNFRKFARRHYFKCYISCLRWTELHWS